jgi:subtilisin family serine protease
VAVIDSGVDTSQEDLRNVIWTNPNEKPGNHLDDDHNGYIDDMHGWDFIGGPTGDIQRDNLELTRLVREQKYFYDSLSYGVVPVQYQKGYAAFRKMNKDYQEKLSQARATFDGISKFKDVLNEIVEKIAKDTPRLADFQIYQPENDDQKKVLEIFINALKQNPDYIALKTVQVDGVYDHFKEQLDYFLNPAYDPRSIVGDDYNNALQRNYGNNDVYGPHADHGTHVAGIIGAIRNNGIGLDGIADHVKIMSVRVVPDGDERDKDVANGIRYAVDNGAKVINMSFGKGYFKDKKIVDDAVKYAMSKDVLMVHAAGNEGKDLDNPENVFFPTKYYADSSGSAAAWLEVGASGPKDDSSLLASFSNYGKNSVDVFAPGVGIYSTIPGNHYASFNGTSMAAPVVTGLAALIREYYPKLSAVQVREIIIKSVSKVNHSVMAKGNYGQSLNIPFKDACSSGGIVNAYSALKMAAEYK